jgi:hypothetical protein
MSNLKALRFAITSLLAIGISSTAKADGIFRPTSFKVTFYEIGLRNSSTGARNPIFQSNDGRQVNLSNPATINLANGGRPQSGSWDQAYALFSNTIGLAGTDGAGCYIRGGASDTDSDGSWEIVTNNAALSGEATTTETSFGFGFLGPGTPAVASSVNGTAVNNLRSYLVSSTNPIPGGGGAIDRFLFIGTLASPVTITDSNSGTINYTVNTSRALETSGGCASVSYSNTTFNISIE